MYQDVFGVPVYTGKVKTHADIKQTVLDEIFTVMKDPRCRLEGGGERVFTDYRMGNEPITRKYRDMVIEAVTPNIREFAAKVGGKKFNMGQIWFHHYEHYSFFNTHHHWPALFSVVYYLQFDHNKHEATTFSHPSKLQQQIYERCGLKTSTIWKPKVKEGDMIIFPSYIDHFAPMCVSEDPRTVIAFNFDMTG